MVTAIGIFCLRISQAGVLHRLDREARKFMVVSSGMRTYIKDMKIIQGPAGLDIKQFTQRLKNSPAISGAGMVLVHNGFVRANDISGNTVEKIEVQVDSEKLAAILEETGSMPGVIAVDAEIITGTLSVGDDIMLLGVAGDTRQNVINALSTALDRIKAGVTSKKQHLV